MRLNETLQQQKINFFGFVVKKKIFWYDIFSFVALFFFLLSSANYLDNYFALRSLGRNECLYRLRRKLFRVEWC